ncbi:UNVERIFIED_CONTAM: hypothetical protein NCL1_39834 [Trichonephila clavipes]
MFTIEDGTMIIRLVIFFTLGEKFGEKYDIESSRADSSRNYHMLYKGPLKRRLVHFSEDQNLCIRCDNREKLHA